MLEAQGRREFRGHAEQVAAARRFVVSAIRDGDPARDVSRLLVSEAATNALLHSASGDDGGSFAVEYAVSDHLLRVEVHDGGGPTGPKRRVHDIESMTGRGLDLFDALSDRWGVDGTPDGWTVWFELNLTPQEARTGR
ncbi:MAG TPA: ATP-binding protein [Actinomycetota bacterium]|jgi:anti-sigma regulatory factor (Ser/Thr protein kinase)|nr:ATP-binding protein [Actinomycetota bacterium]